MPGFSFTITAKAREAINEKAGFELLPQEAIGKDFFDKNPKTVGEYDVYMGETKDRRKFLSINAAGSYTRWYECKTDSKGINVEPACEGSFGTSDMDANAAKIILGAINPGWVSQAFLEANAAEVTKLVAAMTVE